MSKRQPTLAEARRLQDEGILVLRECTVRGEHQSGFSYYRRGHKKGVTGGFTFFNWPFSYIDKRCDDCRRVLVERRDGPGQHLIKSSDLEEWKWGHPGGGTLLRERVHVCLGCANVRRAFFNQVETVYANNLSLNRIRKEVSKCRKQQSRQPETCANF